MVVKTDSCAFSEAKVYPGKGSRFVTRTGQLIVLSGSKATAMYHQRKRPALLRWTQAWRRQHKKLNVETGQKRKTRRVVKTVQRSFVGLSAEEVSIFGAVRRATCDSRERGRLAAGGRYLVSATEKGPIDLGSMGWEGARAQTAVAGERVRSRDG